jgi:hypothetical protein
VNAYSRLTFLRRIPPGILRLIQEAPEFKKWTVSVFLEKFDPSAQAVAGRKGNAGYSLKEGKRHAKVYTSQRYMRAIPSYAAIRAFVKQQYTPNGSREPEEVTVIKGGLEINGPTPWKINTACLFNKSQAAVDGLQVGCGVVRAIIRWVNDVETYLILCIQTHELYSFAPLRSTATISKTPSSTPPVWMDWTKLTHSCKIVAYAGTSTRAQDKENVATLILVHATDPAHDAAHYAQVKSLTSRPL